MPRTWLLSGIPRSGTSLCCRLAGDLPDTVALSEPLRLKMFEGVDSPRSACARIGDFTEQMRARILEERRAPSMHVEGRLYDNIVASGHVDRGLRQRQGEWHEIAIDKPLSARFTLLIRQNALFAALLPWLAVSFSCLAVVRNPLALLASWQTVDLPIHRGRIPGGEQIDRKLRDTLEREQEVLPRQIIVLNWFFAKYLAHMAPGNIIRYEDLVGSGGLTLFHSLGHARARPAPLKNRNDNVLYDKATIDTLLKVLLESGGIWTRFYSPADCVAVADRIRHGR